MGAFNDNLFRQALVTALVFGALADGDSSLVALAPALFMAPFFLFSAIAGGLADAGDKVLFVRAIKAAEIAVMILAALALAAQSAGAALFVLFLMGAQSAFFGPVKYALPPRMLPRALLIAANGCFAASTFAAILLGGIAGALLGADPALARFLYGALIAAAAAGFIAALATPRLRADPPATGAVCWNPWPAAKAALRVCRAKPAVFRAVLAISWFWLIGAVLLSQFPLFVRDALRYDESLYYVLLAAVCGGVAAGCGGGALVLRGQISARFAPFALAALGAFLIHLGLTAVDGGGGGGALQDLPGESGWRAALLAPPVLRAMIDAFLCAAAAGFYVVPLYALVQAEAEPSACSRVIAANNIINAGFIVAAAVAAAALLAAGMPVGDLFVLLGGLTVAAALWCRRFLPRDTIGR